MHKANETTEFHKINDDKMQGIRLCSKSTKLWNSEHQKPQGDYQLKIGGF